MICFHETELVQQVYHIMNQDAEAGVTKFKQKGYYVRIETELMQKNESQDRLQSQSGTGCVKKQENCCHSLHKRLLFSGRVCATETVKTFGCFSSHVIERSYDIKLFEELEKHISIIASGSTLQRGCVMLGQAVVTSKKAK
ncbi:hypothetical protein F2Q69_00050111 [Brassica cretica]|uniref:Uncharacterized protein n=1 Tax=Brassica cretica TaxID=69181 RepID=A0A8S9PVV4_BRACR|nr:hypothetical protein F2Q69_00050111 [Brassica cretica]